MRFLFLGGALGAVLAFLLRNRDAVLGMLDQTPLNKVRASNLEDMTTSSTSGPRRLTSRAART